MHRITLALVSLLFSIAHAEPVKVRLWPDGAPGAKGQEDNDQPFV